MKKDIHAKYYNGVKIVCICGKTHEVNASVEGPIKVESCPKCHSTYTGEKSKIVIKGRMEKFLEKQKRMEALKKAA